MVLLPQQPCQVSTRTKHSAAHAVDTFASAPLQHRTDELGRLVPCWHWEALRFTFAPGAFPPLSLITHLALSASSFFAICAKVAAMLVLPWSTWRVRAMRAQLTSRRWIRQHECARLLELVARRCREATPGVSWSPAPNPLGAMLRLLAGLVSKELFGAHVYIYIYCLSTLIYSDLHTTCIAAM